MLRKLSMLVLALLVSAVVAATQAADTMGHSPSAREATKPSFVNRPG